VASLILLASDPPAVSIADNETIVSVLMVRRYEKATRQVSESWECTPERSAKNAESANIRH